MLIVIVTMANAMMPKYPFNSDILNTSPGFFLRMKKYALKFTPNIMMNTVIMLCISGV